MTVFKTFRDFESDKIKVKPTQDMVSKAERIEQKRLERESIRKAERERVEAEEKRILEEAIRLVKIAKHDLNKKVAKDLKLHLSGEASLQKLIEEQEEASRAIRAERERIAYEARKEAKRIERERLDRIREARLESQYALERAERKLREIEAFAIRTNTTVYTPINSRKIKFD
jgi:hypothetical protein